MVLRMKGNELNLPITMLGEIKILIEWKLLLLRKLHCPWSSLLQFKAIIIKNSDCVFIIFHD